MQHKESLAKRAFILISAKDEKIDFTLQDIEKQAPSCESIAFNNDMLAF